MTKETTLYNYQGFVDSVTSEPSKDLETFIARLRELDQSGVNVPRFITGGIGMADESGEFAGYVKKVLFHGKPLNEENIVALRKELGDVLWYWANACTSLGFDPYEIIQENIEKLESRYPGGFSAWLSENRKPEDI